MLRADEYAGVPASSTNFIEQVEFLGFRVVFLRNGRSCHSRSIRSRDSFDKLRLNRSIIVVKNTVNIVLRLHLSGHLPYFFNIIDPSEPGLKVIVATVHHLHIFLTHLIDHVEFREKTACSKMFDVFHSRLHEFFEVESRRLVVVIAKYRTICVSSTSGRMFKTCPEVVEPSYRLKTNTMLRIDFSDLLRDDIVGVLHVDTFRQTWNHHQRVQILISGPRLVDEFVGNHVLAIPEG